MSRLVAWWRSRGPKLHEWRCPRCGNLVTTTGTLTVREWRSWCRAKGGCRRRHDGLDVREIKGGRHPARRAPDPISQPHPPPPPPAPARVWF